MSHRRPRQSLQARQSLLANEPASSSSPPPGVALHAWIRAQSKAPAARLSARSTLLDASMFQQLMAANLQLGPSDPPLLMRQRRQRRQRERATCSRCGAALSSPSWSLSSSSSSSASSSSSSSSSPSSIARLRGGCRACGEGLSLSTNARAFAESAGLLLRKEEAAAPLSEKQWDAVESDCAARTDGNCPICMEPFARGHQVMLSCSHIFHKTCLQSFERFVKAEARACPLCRHRNYQKKLTVKGTEAHLKRCATLIQALWRGHRARSAFRQMLKQYYSAGRGNPIARRKFFQRELSICTASIEAATSKRTAALDELMADMDRTIRENQQLTTLLDHAASAHAANQQRLRAAYERPPNGGRNPSDRIDWDAVALTALQRCEDEVCAICMGGFRDGKAMSLLSCSHVFHTACISSFEQFNLHSVDTCPVCRSRYQSKSIDANFFAPVAA